MTWIVEEDEVGLDALGTDSDQGDAEVRLPATVGRRSRVEEDGALLDLEPRNVAVTVDDAVDATGVPARGGAGGATIVTVEQDEGEPTDGELDGHGQDSAEVGFVVVALDGKGGRDLLQRAEDRRGVDVAGVEDQPDPESGEEVRHLGGKLPRAASEDVGIGEDADDEQALESRSARRRRGPAPGSRPGHDDARGGVVVGPDRPAGTLEPADAPRDPIRRDRLVPATPRSATGRKPARLTVHRGRKR
jgi:hypothetical protein